MTPVVLFLLYVSLSAVPTVSLTLRAAAIAELLDDNSTDVSETIERANAGIETKLIHGDILPSLTRNAVPCTAAGCKWPKTGKYVYVPVDISTTSFNTEQRNFIIRGLLTFHESTCIRFVWRQPHHRDFVYIFSGAGCYSYLGRQVRGQSLSLQRDGCLSVGTVQHEILHALGFHHEQVRSDRDSFVSILTENIQSGREHNFRKVMTNNLRTAYDYRSVMHYSKYAFSKNGKPTIVAKTDPNIVLGRATRMNSNDILRVNRLYECCE
ncbi:high choriolytic enzyme 1-like [Halichoeres trimaculatus]|uniref:high choriolytic enzyme 1-like n=1 Tax=Halichoeres trimaculatus TaxID=147232 RepID=UPI003D9DE422